MVALTFPDGARREYPQGTTGLDIAKGISPSLAKRTVAMALDGTVADLADPIEKDAKIEFISREDPRALELIRHDAAQRFPGIPPPRDAPPRKEVPCSVPNSPTSPVEACPTPWP